MTPPIRPRLFLNANLDVIMEAAAATGVPTSDSPAELIVPTGHHDCMGRFDESRNVLTLAGDENLGDFKRLCVAKRGGKEWQSLLLFDLARRRIVRTRRGRGHAERVLGVGL